MNRQKLFRAVLNSDVARNLTAILVDASYKKVPEIHFVPKRLGLDVFYVNEKVETLFRTLPKDCKDGIMARIKLMAGLNIDEKDYVSEVYFDFDFDPNVVIGFSLELDYAQFGKKIILKLQS